MVSSQPEKMKTKAKQRYLKAKRDKRKKRKVAAAEAVQKSAIKERTKEKQKAARSQRVAALEEATLTFGESSDDLELDITVISQAKEKAKEKERPSKKRKVDKTDTTLVVTPSPSRNSSPESIEHVAMDEDVLDPSTMDSTPFVAFPMPSAPAAASPKVLALQGLDPGLIDAEIVDSAQTISIESSETDSSSRLGLSAKTRKRLKELGITELFAVQTALLPFLLPSSQSQRALYLPYNPSRDVCVSAPTGSGKTLAYVIPVIEFLSARIVTRLRALVVLPTRDLVTQVRETFETMCKGRGLKIASATGQHSFAHEQTQLVEDSFIPLQGGSSKVDILICTPGRLIDHLKGTPNFTLQHLRFLVIDEADRLLASSFQDWLAQVLSATRPRPRASLLRNTQKTAVNISDVLPRHDAIAPAWLPLPSSRTRYDEKRESSCQKLLFSATLTRDPAKIASLELRDAKYFVVTNTLRPDRERDHLAAKETFAFPSALSEHMIVCSSYKKPLILFYLIHKHNVTNALVFTKSAESTNRLVKLFECFENALGPGSGAGPLVARAYSSDLNTQERKSMLEKFKSQEITILVCSDLISRGIDISHVSHVVSYDTPIDMRKYVHRVGRTARAGRKGDAWSLIEEQEARYFKSMLNDADHLTQVRKMKVSEVDLKEYNDPYESAMKAYSAKHVEDN